MRVLGLEHVEPDLARPRAVPVGGDELELRLGIDEPANEPRARDSIDVHPLPRHPCCAPGSRCGGRRRRRLRPLEARLEPGELFVGGLTARGPEEVDGDDLRQAPLQAADVRRDLSSPVDLPTLAAAPQSLQQPLRVRLDLAVVRVPRCAKQRLDLAVGEAIHEVCFAYRSPPTAGHDLPHLPLEVLDRVLRAG